jgi:hypothetical protein
MKEMGKEEENRKALRKRGKSRLREQGRRGEE